MERGAGGSGKRTGDSSCGRLEEALRRTACGFLLSFSPAPRRHAPRMRATFNSRLVPGIGKEAGRKGRRREARVPGINWMPRPVQSKRRESDLRRV